MENKKKFNPKVGSGFSNDNFGKGSIKIDLDADGIKAFIENAQVGGAILLRYHKDTKYGNKFYFAELLEPYNIATGKSKTPKKVTTPTSELD